MASQPPTPFDIFGSSPFKGPELLGGLAGEMLGGMPPADPALSQPMLSLIGGNDTPPEPDPIINKLGPDTELHRKTIEKLDAMLNFSANAMKQNYSRWNFMEHKVQAFIPNQDYEGLMESIATKGSLPPEPIQVVVPYTYATLHAANTYICSVLLGRKPVFGLTASRGTSVDNARYMEQALQYNLDESGGHEILWQQSWDGLTYCFGGTRISWEETSGPVMKMVGGERKFEDGLIYSGNKLAPVDPYCFFPDPRVPLHQCPKRGDFLFDKIEVSKLILYDMEEAQKLKWTREACDKYKGGGTGMGTSDQPSDRRVRIGQPAQQWLMPKDVTAFICAYQGTVRLVPKDWGLGDKETSELWKFTWTKNGQIMQAQPLGMLHGMHPYALQEPNTLGYDFMSLSQGEMITVFQDILSWLVSSRMENVRASIANTFIADPARVEINDIRSTTIGRVIRMKQSAMGLPIQQAIEQLVVNDVTGGHFQDIQTMRMLADATTGVNDSLRGTRASGGRRSATEARIDMQAGASRLAQMAVRISAQSLHPMASQMTMNIQQLMPPEMWVEITGDTGQKASQKVTPDMLAGSFNYAITDGSLPMDKAALTEVWKEILFGIARDPELRQRYDIGEIFEYTAELGGAKNIDSFRRPPQPQIAPPGQQPEGQPVGAAVPPLPPGQVFSQ